MVTVSANGKTFLGQCYSSHAVCCGFLDPGRQGERERERERERKKRHNQKKKVKKSPAFQSISMNTQKFYKGTN